MTAPNLSYWGFRALLSKGSRWIGSLFHDAAPGEEGLGAGNPESHTSPKPLPTPPHLPRSPGPGIPFGYLAGQGELKKAPVTPPPPNEPPSLFDRLHLAARRMAGHLESVEGEMSYAVKAYRGKVPPSLIILVPVLSKISKIPTHLFWARLFKNKSGFDQRSLVPIRSRRPPLVPEAENPFP